MGLRTKLKIAKSEIERQRKLIAGLDRRNRFLLDLCKNAENEIELRNEENKVLMLLVNGCVLAAGGKITVHTVNLKKILEGYEIAYQLDDEHVISITMNEKEQV
ncbi:MAG: hypothetical protein ACI4AO_03605 [Anaerotignum sp.]